MLNKKALRRCADPGLTIPANHGLLHAEQISYLLRSAVKCIDHRRTLVVYVYDRKRAEHGDFIPAWTVFFTKNGYITFDHGNGKWRTAAFDHLGSSYNFPYKCAFYSSADEQRVKFYLKDEHDGILALISAQQDILAVRCRERRRKEERKTIARMSKVKAAPRKLKGWIHKSVMPAYFICDHASSQKPVAGLCTACRHEVTLPYAKHNDEAVCPHCGRKLKVKSRAKFSFFYDRDTVQVIQQPSPGELLIRVFKVYYDYAKSAAPSEYVYEAARIFARRSPEGQVIFEPYYYGSGGLTNWKPGLRPDYICYRYQFEGDLCGHVYPADLAQALTGSPWQYCPLEAFCRHGGPMELMPFLHAYFKHPRLEHLVKMGFYALASDLVYRSIYRNLLDESKNRTHQILGVAAEDVDFLREIDVNSTGLESFHKYAGIKDRQKLFRWQQERRVSRDILPILAHTTAHKLMKYVDTQYAMLCTHDKKGRYSEPQSVVSEYRDYLDMCAKLNYAAKSKSTLFPKNLQKAHDQAAGQIKLQKDELTLRNFEKAYRRIMGRLDFTQNGLKIVYPQSPEELVKEGSALRHCVGGYGDRIANKECIVLFLRRCSEPEKPFYTIEVQDGHIVQLRGLQNCDATPEVRQFADVWERNVLLAPDVPNAA